MLSRTLSRTFKTWVQYQAERLGTTEANLLSIRDSINTGQYSAWRHRSEVTKKIRFLLDHCTPEEQKLYIKEFSTEDLTRFLLGDLYNIPSEEVAELDDLKVSYHALPGLNLLFKFPTFSAIQAIIGNDDLTRLNKAKEIAKELLEAKLKELEWKKLDQQISSSA